MRCNILLTNRVIPHSLSDTSWAKHKPFLSYWPAKDMCYYMLFNFSFIIQDPDHPHWAQGQTGGFSRGTGPDYLDFKDLEDPTSFHSLQNLTQTIQNQENTLIQQIEPKHTSHSPSPINSPTHPTVLIRRGTGSVQPPRVGKSKMSNFHPSLGRNVHYSLNIGDGSQCQSTGTLYRSGPTTSGGP